MTNKPQFEVWYKNIDMTLVGIESADSILKRYHLCPYSTSDIKKAFSHKSTFKRIATIDNAIMKCMKL